MQTPARDIADGRSARRGIIECTFCYAETLDVAYTTTHPHPEVLAEPHVHTETQREILVAVAPAECRDDHRMGVGSKAGFGIFQIEAPAEREADRNVVGMVPSPTLAPRPTVSAPSRGKLSLYLRQCESGNLPQEDASTAPDSHTIEGSSDNSTSHREC